MDISMQQFDFRTERHWIIYNNLDLNTLSETNENQNGA